jgi:hypothetical protein
MPTAPKAWRATPDDERRIKRIKHCAGYLTDAKAIRKALEFYDKHLNCKKEDE